MAKKILIIDDELDMVAVTKTRLEKSGYEVLAVVSAEEGFVWLEKNAPDLILLDLLLPKMQGEDACKQIKSDTRLKHIPVILFTASTSDISKLTREIGADDYITKPFESQELLLKIQELLKEADSKLN